MTCMFCNAEITSPFSINMDGVEYHLCKECSHDALWHLKKKIRAMVRSGVDRKPRLADKKECPDDGVVP